MKGSGEGGVASVPALQQNRREYEVGDGAGARCSPLAGINNYNMKISVSLAVVKLQRGDGAVVGVGARCSPLVGDVGAKESEGGIGEVVAGEWRPGVGKREGVF
ncbi:hypothetical protein C2S53_019121 [Perilla frutescens var. hirtella]|uniref:Uncharacterized protein n=1 Tax=Perilla frutescens var. hirtella TaxID=608512 RepID=A0AAD4JH09_PERFH|nr:hypothetical protein C2S53_019121 [Perilla frutescens var. hirtella]